MSTLTLEEVYAVSLVDVPAVEEFAIAKSSGEDLDMDDDKIDGIMDGLESTIKETAQETAKKVAQERRESTPTEPEDDIEDDVEDVEKSADPLANPFFVRDVEGEESRAAVKKRLGDRKDRFRKRHKERVGMSGAKIEALTGDPVGDALAPDGESSEEIEKRARRASNTFVADALARESE